MGKDVIIVSRASGKEKKSKSSTGIETMTFRTPVADALTTEIRETRGQPGEMNRYAPDHMNSHVT